MSLAIVQEWSEKLDAGDIEVAALLVSDCVMCSSPKETTDGLEAWKARAPKVKKEGIEWGPLEQGDRDNEVVTIGKKKIGFVTITVKRTIFVDDNGQISKLTVRKA